MRQKLCKQPWMKFIWYAVFSWLAAISMSGVAGYRITEINMVIPMLMAGALYVIVYFDNNRKGKSCKYAWWFAIPFALTLALGSGFDMEDRIFYGYSVLTLLYFIVLTIFFMMLTVNVTVLLDKVGIGMRTQPMSESQPSGCKKGKCLWLVASVCCLIAWLPYFLTYYPGIVSPDYVEIIRQCMGDIPLTNHHPVLFVFFIKIILMPCYHFGGMQFAAAVVTIVHMLLFACMLGYMAYWLSKKGIGKTGYVLTVAFIACNPVIAVFSVYITKDVLFGGIFLLYILKLYDIVESKGDILKDVKGMIGFLLLNLLVVLLRNNGIYITVLLLLISLFVYRDMWKQLAVCVLIVVAAYGMLKGPVFQTLGIAGESFAESMSVPLQQVGYVICQDGAMSEENEDFLDRLMPMERVKEVYRPGYTDPYKFDEAFDDAFLNANKGEFLKVWARLLPHHLGSYIEAYLMQTAGYWHIGETDTLNPYGVIENNLGISQLDVIEHMTGISLAPVIEKLILACRKAPVICFVTNMAFMVFLAYFICIRCFRNKKKQYIIPFLPLLLLWATIMVAAPAYCKFRYLLPYHLAYPFMIWILLYVSAVSDEKGV